MKKCEYCDAVVDGNYGSGRFCNKKCASGFSSKERRKEINLIVSAKLKGRPAAHDFGFKKGKDWKGKPFSKEDWDKAVEACKRKRAEFYATASWDKLPLAERRRRVYNKQEGKCLLCGLNEWLEKPIKLEFDHIDGNHYDNARENVRYLCPNCHSQTPTYRNLKRQKGNAISE